MIRDYLRGMQMAYFPPFKMFFLLLTLWLVVDSGLNIQFVNRDKQNEKETEQIFSRFKPKASLNATDDKADEKKNGILFTKEEKEKMFNQEYKQKEGELYHRYDSHLWHHSLTAVLQREGGNLLRFAEPAAGHYSHQAAVGL